MTPQQELDYEYDQLERTVKEFIEHARTTKNDDDLDIHHYALRMEQHIKSIQYAHAKVKKLYCKYK